MLLLAVILTTGAACGMVAVLVTAGIRGPEHVRVEGSAYVAAAIGAALFAAYVLLGGFAHPRSWQARRLARHTQAAPSRVQQHAEALALSVGLERPEVLVIRGKAVNAATFGHGRVAHIVVTENACRLHNDRLDALLAYCVVQLADRHLHSVRDSLTAVSLYANMTRAMWGLVFVGYIVGELSSGAGPWVEVTAIGALGIVVAVLCGALATLAAIGLAHAADSLADSDAIACTMRPDAYAHLLVALAEDSHETDADLSPLLWMERDTVRKDLATIIGCIRGQHEIETRARRICAIAGEDAPAGWRTYG